MTQEMVGILESKKISLWEVPRVDPEIIRGFEELKDLAGIVARALDNFGICGTGPAATMKRFPTTKSMSLRKAVIFGSAAIPRSSTSGRSCPIATRIRVTSSWPTFIRIFSWRFRIRSRSQSLSPSIR